MRSSLRERLDAPAITDMLMAAQSRVRMNGRHQYDLLIGDVWVRTPNVTAVTGEVDKSWLGGWAAKEQLAVDVNTAWGLLDRAEDFMRGGFDAFWLAFRDAVGRTKAYRKKTQEAADLGNEVHQLIEHWLAGKVGVTVEEPNVSDPALHIYAGFERWAEDVRLEPVAIEQRLFSLKHQVAGTFDFLGFVEGRLELVDWKTARAVYPAHRLQHHAYRGFLEEMGVPGVGGRIVRLPKGDAGGEIEVVPVDDDHREGYRTFLNLLQVHRWLATVKQASPGGA